MTDKVPRDREEPGWWRPGERRALCLWCGASFQRPKALPGVVLQACGKEACKEQQAAYEDRLVAGAPSLEPKRLDREQRMALWDLADVSDPDKAERLRRSIVQHGVEKVTAENYL